MCGACGTGIAAAPWETQLVGEGPRAGRALAAAATRATGARITVRTWGAAGFVSQARTAPLRTHPNLESLCHALLPALRLGLPEPAGSMARRLVVPLPGEVDVPGLTVWSALAASSGAASIALCGPISRQSARIHGRLLLEPSAEPGWRVAITAPCAEECAHSLQNFLSP
ncbi:hypothetical protein [Sciscionella sediminilitoris]|uniref:hypothetical protein n=1 Tax=Sciscionella sediminilitoris TaxID=1445613 RepID=UPI0004DEE9B1|nr:hypothetical protein [Sciscionella sp. SE31]